MIEATSLSRRYGKIAAVDDVSFSIGDHDVVGLLGHNGAGKTTIMKMLCGCLEPTSGRITVDGVDVMAEPRRLQQFLGYLPENLPLYPRMAVAEYLEYMATIKGIRRRERMRSVREVIETTDLQRFALAPIHTLSRGSRQRVGVAQALLGHPRLLVLDEPTNGLDPAQTWHMRELLRQYAKQATIILSTHILQEVDAVCDRVLLLREGQLAIDRTLPDLHNSRVLRLRTGKADASLAAALDQLPGVASAKKSPGEGDTVHFDIQLQPDASTDSAARAVAQCVVSAGADLYQLDVVERDLDSVFREVYGDAN